MGFSRSPPLWAMMSAVMFGSISVSHVMWLRYTELCFDVSSQPTKHKTPNETNR